jgi:hypothetical protein
MNAEEGTVEKTVTHIEIRYSDGSFDWAAGDNAQQIMDWYKAAEQMLCLHGGVYKGPKLISHGPLEGSAPPAER